MVRYYKSARYINGKIRLIILDDDYNKIIYPTKEQLDDAILGDPPKNAVYVEVQIRI